MGLRPFNHLGVIAHFSVVVLFLQSLTALNASPRNTQASELAIEPIVDGIIFNDPAWQGVNSTSGFTQIRPNEGAPAQNQTEVRIGFTADTLYIGVICYDDDPSAIIVSGSRRDGNLQNSDSFRVVIDSFHDQQNGFVFGTNPAGLAFDAQVINEASDRFGSGGGGLNTDWDTTWNVKSTIFDRGWSAEFAIPFTSLRYGRETIQTWGINFERIVRRTNEVSYWAPLPRQYNLFRLSLAGTIDKINVPSQKNLKITPYILGAQKRGGPQNIEANNEEVGIDIKYSITPSLTLDATYNTDFAQVESDSLQVNLDRFSLFFPEKRPFFLENAGQFSVGVPREVELFFSRRIGIGPRGEQLPIVGGLRLSGKLGNSTNIGLLQMRSDRVSDIAEETDFSVVRFNHELANRSSIGMLLVNKEGGLYNNQTYAFDGRWGIGDNGLLQGFVAKTHTPDMKGDDYAWRIGGNYDSEKWGYSGAYSEVGEGFNPEVGFLARKNYRKANAFIMRRIRPQSLWGLLEWRPHASYDGYWDFDGFYETGRIHIDSSLEWKNGAQAHTAINLTHEGVKQDFQIVRDVTVTKGKYDHKEFTIYSGTDNSAKLSGGLQLVAGGFFGGDRFRVSPSIRYRIGETFNASLSYNHNDIDLPGGNFEVNLTSLRLSYSFTPKISLQAFVQHNERDNVLATNLRFAWLQEAGAGLYIVYNETDDDINSPGRPRKELVIKYSRILDLL